MKTWIRPMVIEECYVSNESIANSVTACYKIACNVGGPKYEGHETILMVQIGTVEKRVVYGMNPQGLVTVQMQTQTEY